MRLLKNTTSPDGVINVRIETKMPHELVLRLDEIAPPPERSEFIRAAVEKALNELAQQKTIPIRHLKGEK